MQRNVVAMFTLLCLSAGGLASTLLAHHSFAAEFDATKPITLKGTVTKMDWTNPHTWIYLNVRKPNGAMEQWACEGGSPNALFRRGFTKGSLPAGVNVVIDGYQAKNGSKRASCRDITFADGRRMFLGSSGAGAPPEVIPEKDRVPSKK
jgi:hypothetical protein